MKTLIYASPAAAISFGLHARAVGPEPLDLADELRLLARSAGAPTPTLDALLECVREAEATAERKEVA